MKKLLLLVSIFLVGFNSYAQNRWNVGLQLAAVGNMSTYSGGMSDANALFTHAPYGAGQFGVYFRYRLNDRFSLQSGFDGTRIGFNYALAKNYSLLNENEHYNVLQSSAAITRLPVMLIYNSKLNCRNVRFIAGAGFALVALDNKWTSAANTEISSESANNASTTFMSEETHSLGEGTTSFTWLLGVEKVFKRGSMLDFTIQANYGFSDLAESTVYYTADSKDYSHTFRNNGSYAAFAITYYFRPIGSGKMKS